MLRIVSFRSVLITVWSDAPDVTQIRAYAKIAPHFCASRPGGTALLNAIIRGTPVFPERVRDETVKVMRMRGVFRSGVAHVITVGGFAGTATRAFLSTAILVGRPKSPSRVFGVPAEGCEWLAARVTTVAEPVTTPELRAAYDEAIAGR